MIEQHMVQEKAESSHREEQSHSGHGLIFDHGDTPSEFSCTPKSKVHVGIPILLPNWPSEPSLPPMKPLALFCIFPHEFLPLSCAHTSHHFILPSSKNPTNQICCHTQPFLQIQFHCRLCRSSQVGDYTLRHQDWEMHGKIGAISINLYSEFAFVWQVQ